MASLLLALVVSAWPPARDAGPATAAAPSSWPDEPGWVQTWPLLGFTPPGWSLAPSEAAAGVGMGVDLAWSVTRGAPDVVLAVIAARHDVADPTLAPAWRLNGGEFPDAGDVNGDGRLDLRDFAGDARVRDVNANGALDLQDLLESLSDGVDDDGNGRIDDLCGWDFERGASLSSAPDGGREGWRRLAAPVNDGLAGAGVCPGCTLLPLAATRAQLPQAVAFAADAGARAVLLPADEGELSEALTHALDEAGRRAVLVTPGSGGLVTLPLALHPAVWSPRALTADEGRTTAQSRRGCGGLALAGGVSISSEGCAEAAAERLVGLAGLLFSARAELEPLQVIGLLGGARANAARAVALAEQPLPPAPTPRSRLRPALGALSAAEGCALESPDGEVPFACDGGVPHAPLRALENEPEAAWVRVLERAGPYEFSTALPAPHPDARRGLIRIDVLGAGSGPPRYVALEGFGGDTVLATSPSGLVGASTVVKVISPPLGAGRAAFSVGNLEGDRFLEVFFASDDGQLHAVSLSGLAIEGFPRALRAPLAGAPLVASAAEGASLVTVDVQGQVWHRAPRGAWTFELGAPQVSGPAAGDLDGDAWVDLAIANGSELRVLRNDARGPTASSWRAPTRATQALLGNLGGDERLEVVVDRVYDAVGRSRVELGGWAPPVTPPALARVDASAHRSLVQVEARGDGRFELVRYAVERALRGGDALAPRDVLLVFAHPPARGGFAVADVTGDQVPDVLLPTEDGLLFLVDGLGRSPPQSPLPTFGTVLSSPAVGVTGGQLEFAVRTTRGDLVRWQGVGVAADISWESAGHDRGQTWNAETKLPVRPQSGLGITGLPEFEKPCGCRQVEGLAGLALLFLFRRPRRTC